jgi:hypothetical protein
MDRVMLEKREEIGKWEKLRERRIQDDKEGTLS